MRRPAREGRATGSGHLDETILGRREPAHRVGHLLRRHRAAEEISLHLGAVARAQEVGLAGVLHALGDQPEPRLCASAEMASTMAASVALVRMSLTKLRSILRESIGKRLR